jgi:hypothetical protein
LAGKDWAPPALMIEAVTTTTLEFVIQSDSIEALLAEGDKYVQSLVSPQKTARFSSVVIIAVGDKGNVDGEFTYELPRPDGSYDDDEQELMRDD